MKKLCCILVLLTVAAVVAVASWAQSAGTAPAAPADTTAAQKEQPPAVELKVDTAFAYCALEMTGNYDQHQAAFEKLYQEAMKQGIYGGMPFGIYWNSPANTPVEKLLWDVGFALPPGNAPKPPLTLKKWEFTTMVSLKYRGVFGGEEMGQTYGRLYQWIGENGYQPAGPLMEVYLNTPSPDEKGVLYGAVEIIVPVQKAPPAPAKDAKVK
jgi:AraC family transcriptional regulator